MRKTMLLAMAALLCLTLATGCSTQAGEAVPSPTAPISASPSVLPSVSPGATGTAAQAEVYNTVGQAAVITAGTGKVNGNAYYAGNTKDTMLFPLGEVAKALGWTVNEPDSVGNVEMKISKTGGDEIIVAYTKPELDNAGNIADVKVTKAGKAVEIGTEPMPYIGGMLYVTEAFIDKAVQEVDVTYDGALKIDIKPKG